MVFEELIRQYDWEGIAEGIQSQRLSNVERALYRGKRDFHALLALLSPAAEEFLEEMAHMAHGMTVRQFGRVMQMYAPLYISSKCTNSCRYCGFNRHNFIRRATLSLEEVEQEASFLYKKGFRHILLVSGESPRDVNLEYLCSVAETLRGKFASISIEIYPLGTKAYQRLIRCGVDGLTIYQETYHRKRYGQVHPAGPKRDFNFRLSTPERGGTAGFRRLNIGALLGLSPWRVEGVFVGLHAAFLSQTFWRSHVSVSFPRLRPAAGGFQPDVPVSDRALVQLVCALRILLPRVGLVLSTREPSKLRDHLFPLGFTQVSAGSRTAPGGYGCNPDAGGQFEISDRRSPREVARAIRSRGYEPVWKDWDAAFLESSNT